MAQERRLSAIIRAQGSFKETYEDIATSQVPRTRVGIHPTLLLLALMLTPLHILALMDNMHARRVTEAVSIGGHVGEQAGGWS